MAGFKASQARGSNGRWVAGTGSNAPKFVRAVHDYGHTFGPTNRVQYAHHFGPVIPRNERAKLVVKRGVKKGLAAHQKHLQPKINAYYATPWGKAHAAWSKDRLERLAPKGSGRDLAVRIGAVASGVASAAATAGIPIVGPAVAFLFGGSTLGSAWNLADWGIEAYRRYKNPPPPPPPLKLPRLRRRKK